MKSQEINFPPEILNKFNEFWLDLESAFKKSVESYDETIKKNRKLLQSNYQHVGKIIHSHLIIENLVNEALFTLRYNKKILNNSFCSKIKKLPTSGKLYSFLIPGIINLNRIRNKIAHNLDYEITERDMNIIDEYLVILKIKNSKKYSIEKRIQKFVILCMSFFSFHNREIRDIWSLLSKKHKDSLNELKKLKVYEIL